MRNTIACELIDDIVIEYDMEKDCLMLSKQYQNYFDTANPIYNFSDYIIKNQVFDEESQTNIIEKLSHMEKIRDCFQLEVKVLNRVKKYERFQIKGRTLRDKKKIIAVVKSLKIMEQAYIDPLTKIYNRNGLEEKMLPYLENCSKEEKIALLIIDLDNFKQINDNLGHLLGDALLNEVAMTLRKNFPENSIIGRIGGDEFVVFLYHIKGEREIKTLTGELCNDIAERYAKKEEQFGLSVSVGIAITDKPVRYDKLYVQADTALYQAKYNGKNQSALYQNQNDVMCSPFAIKQENKIIETSVKQLGSNEEQRRYKQIKTLLCEIIDVLNNVEDTKTALTMTMQLIGEGLDVTRTYVNCYVKDGSCFGDCYYYSKVEKQDLPEHLPLKRDEYIKNFDEDGIFFCTNIKEVNEPFQKELVRLKVGTMLQVLIRKDGEVIGILGVNSSNKKRLWVQKEVDFIYTVGKLITNYIWQMQKEIEEDKNREN